MSRAEYIPSGRLGDVRSRPDANLYAYTLQGYLGETAKVTRYASRLALEAFCKSGSQHHAIVKTPTHPNMMTNANTQRPDLSSPLR